MNVSSWIVVGIFGSTSGCFGIADVVKCVVCGIFATVLEIELVGPALKIVVVESAATTVLASATAITELGVEVAKFTVVNSASELVDDETIELSPKLVAELGELAVELETVLEVTGSTNNSPC